MYEMYPDRWSAAEQVRRPEPFSAQPRRRTRKEHSVMPAVIALDPATGSGTGLAGSGSDGQAVGALHSEARAGR